MTWGSEWGFAWGGDADTYDYDSLGKQKLWKQLDFAENYRKLIALYATIWAELDAEIVAETQRVGIEGAFGDELDDWGARVGVERLGADDALYRRIIKAEARKKFGQADPMTIYDVVDIFSGGDGSIMLVENFPASWMIWIFGLDEEEQERVADILQGVPGLGIGAGAIIVDPEGVFHWGAADGDVEIDYHWTSASGGIPDSETAGFASARTIQ